MTYKVLSGFGWGYFKDYVFPHYSNHPIRSLQVVVLHHPLSFDWQQYVIRSFSVVEPRLGIFSFWCSDLPSSPSLLPSARALGLFSFITLCATASILTLPGSSGCCYCFVLYHGCFIILFLLFIMSFLEPPQGWKGGLCLDKQNTFPPFILKSLYVDMFNKSSVSSVDALTGVDSLLIR